MNTGDLIYGLFVIRLTPKYIGKAEILVVIKRKQSDFMNVTQ